MDEASLKEITKTTKGLAGTPMAVVATACAAANLPPPRSPDPRRPVWPWVLAAVAAVAGFAVGYVVVAPG